MATTSSASAISRRRPRPRSRRCATTSGSAFCPRPPGPRATTAPTIGAHRNGSALSAAPARSAFSIEQVRELLSLADDRGAPLRRGRRLARTHLATVERKLRTSPRSGPSSSACSAAARARIAIRAPSRRMPESQPTPGRRRRPSARLGLHQQRRRVHDDDAGHHAAGGRGTVATPPPCERARRSEEQPHLDDHLQDRAGADREGERRPVRREGVAAEPDAGDGRQARERGEADEGRQPGPRLDQGRDDADAFGDVVEREAERPGRCRAPRRRWRTPSRSPAPRRDCAGRCRARSRSRAPPRSSLPPLRRPTANSSAAVSAATSQTMAPPWKPGAASAASSSASSSVSTRRNSSSPTVSASTKSNAPRPPALQRRVEQHARAPPARRRRTGRPGRARPGCRGLGVAHRHVDRVLEGDAGPVSITTWCVSPCTQGYGMRSHAVREPRQRPRRVLRELPVGAVDLHLRDRDRLRAAGAHQKRDALAVEHGRARP